MAKQNGGPVKHMEKHANYYFKKGAESKNPIIAAVGLISIGLGIGGTSIYFNVKNRKLAIAIKEAQEIESELIKGMEQTEKDETQYRAQTNIDNNELEDSTEKILGDRR